MSEKTKTRTPQPKEKDLEARIAKLEAQIEAASKYYSNGNDGDQAEQFCSLPQVPDRVFAADVSPDRAGLIQLIGKKWVNGTKLRYYFFESGQFSAGNDQKDLVREGFDIWRDVGIGISFEEVRDISEAEIRIGFLQD